MGEYAFDEDSRVEPGADGEYIEIWASAGTLVAQSRQLALILPL